MENNTILFFSFSHSLDSDGIGDWSIDDVFSY